MSRISKVERLFIYSYFIGWFVLAILYEFPLTVKFSGLNYLWMCYSLLGLAVIFLFEIIFVLSATKVVGDIYKQEFERKDDNDKLLTGIRYTYLGNSYNITTHKMLPGEIKAIGNTMDLLINKSHPARAKVNSIWDLYQGTFGSAFFSGIALLKCLS
jgi:hypothetical protein